MDVGWRQAPGTGTIYMDSKSIKEKYQMAVLKMYTTTWCSDCKRAKRYLSENGVEFEEINIETTPGAAEFVMSANMGKRKVPTFEFEGRVFDLSPYDERRLRTELKLT